MTFSAAWFPIFPIEGFQRKVPGEQV